MAGEVDTLGEGVEGLAAGERVAVEPLVSCGRCPACRAGRDSICPQLQIFGIHCHGGFAEYVSVPARRLFRLAPDLEPLRDLPGVWLAGDREEFLTLAGEVGVEDLPEEEVRAFIRENDWQTRVGQLIEYAEKVREP